MFYSNLLIRRATLTIIGRNVLPFITIELLSPRCLVVKKVKIYSKMSELRSGSRIFGKTNWVHMYKGVCVGGRIADLIYLS